MTGPLERCECPHHAGSYVEHRWTWDTPIDERGASSKSRDSAAHLVALEGGGEPEYVTQCPLCAVDEEDADHDA